MQIKYALLLAAIVVGVALYFFLGVAYTEGAKAACAQMDGRWVSGEDYCEVKR